MESQSAPWEEFAGLKEQIIDTIRKRQGGLPSLPVVINHIIAALGDNKTTTSGLAAIINHDPAMTAKLLQLANSVYYGQREKVNSVVRAISVIGFDEIMGIALGMGLLTNLGGEDGFSLDMKALWIHSIGTATAAKIIAMKINPSLVGKVFIPALLHDIGKVLYTISFPEQYSKVRQWAIEEKIPLYIAESRAFELDHAMVSALLLKRWRLPLEIITPVRFHHSPDSAPADMRYHCLILNLANYLTQKAGLGHSGNPAPMVVKNISRKLGISEDVIKSVMGQLQQKQDQIMEFFRITAS